MSSKAWFRYFESQLRIVDLRFLGSPAYAYSHYLPRDLKLIVPRREGKPWYELLGTIGVNRSMTALQYVRKDLQKFQGRKYRKFRANVLRAARRMDRLVLKGVRVQLAPKNAATVKVYRDGVIIGHFEDGLTRPRHVRFRSC